MATVSHWQADVEAAPNVSADLPATCDIAIIGGGITGVSTAYWLKQRDPSLRVVVLEAETLAHGASGRNAGFLLLGTHTDYASAVDAYGAEQARRLWRFTAENARLIRDALDGKTFDLDWSGSLVAAGSEAEAERFRRSARLLAEEGIEATYLDPAAADDRMGAAGFHGALYVPEGGTLHPAKLVRYLAAESGATVVEGWRAEALEPTAAGVRVRGTGASIETGRVVVAANAYLPTLLPDLASWVRPVRAQMFATAPVARALDVPVYSHAGYFYLRQLPTGEVLLGGARHLHEPDEVGYADITTDPLQADLEGYLRSHFPAFADAEITRRWSGTMGFSTDGLPAFGAVPGVDGAWWVGGFTGHGMGYGFRMGKLVAASLLGEPDPYADLFDARRFEG